jgi:UPF0716 family protein affecting phage T7 exclusion
MQRFFVLDATKGRRLIRLGVILLGLWIVLELLLMKLIANRLGWGTTILIHVLKGGVGLLALGWLIIRGMRGVRAVLDGSVRRLNSVGAFGFPIASAVLVAMPGLVPAMFGIALFSPSLRRVVSERFTGQTHAESPGEIDLDPSEWRETRKPKKPRRAIEGKATLESRPPSV